MSPQPMPPGWGWRWTSAPPRSPRTSWTWRRARPWLRRRNEPADRVRRGRHRPADGRGQGARRRSAHGRAAGRRTQRTGRRRLPAPRPCAQASDIVDAVVVGNTAIHHLFLRLPVRQLAAAAYVPAVREAVDVKAREIGLRSRRARTCICSRTSPAT